jgi:hypothetical protein
MMSQRHSGYVRRHNDHYATPIWVTMVLEKYLPGPLYIWEPAAGEGMMAAALRTFRTAHEVVETDMAAGVDFLTISACKHFNAIITNPPFGIGQEFIEHALALMKPAGGVVAMLMRTDFDHGKTRRHLFGNCPAFAAKIVLTTRIVWFKPAVAAPSFNHAWFIWDWRWNAPPVLMYDYSGDTDQ